MTDKCYSRDEEIFYDDLAEVIEDMQVGDTYYEGEKVTRTAGLFFDLWGAAQIIERIQENAYEEAGEFAEDFATEVSEVKVRELQALVQGWLNENVPANFWTVRNVKKCEVTDDLLTPDGVSGAPAGAPACPGRPDSRCNYLAACGTVCNKCGAVHDGNVRAMFGASAGAPTENKE